ncbi:MAG: hypothetical protein OXC06_08270 [Acidimicrobiaceae bacterium]|nr:hypothetical protein [Acidimicrobiaceae bacterium]
MTRLTADGLLRTAAVLVSESPGRPAEADLRRAVSTAYYAVFCALGEELAKAYDEPLSRSVRRLLSHSGVLEVFGRLTRADRGTSTRVLRWHPDQPVCDADLLRSADACRWLLGAREDADYDHLTSHTKQEAEKAVVRARLAISQIRRAATNSPQQVQAVCIALIASPASRRRLSA